jgi:hypothetical protein
MTLRFIPPLSHATKMALSVAFMVFLLVAGLAIEYWMITSTIDRSNSQWCDTLGLLTKTKVPKPANPKANPSREGQYLFYTNLVQLKDEFGCM